MPDRVHARMNLEQVPGLDSPVNRPLAQPKPKQLSPPHHPMLPFRKQGDVPDSPPSPRQPSLRRGCRGLGGHGAMVSPKALRVVRGV